MTAASHTDNVTKLYDDESAHIVATGGIAYYLTPCCQASGKGSMGAIVCRSCYDEVDSIFAMGWVLTDDRDWADFRRHMLANYPVADELLDAMRAAGTPR